MSYPILKVQSMTYRTALLLIFLSALLDCTLWAIFQHPVSFFSVALFYSLVTRHADLGLIALTCLNALIPLFLLTGTVGVDLLFLIPVGYLLYMLTRRAYVPWYIRVLLVWIAVIVQYLLIDRAIGGISLAGGAFFASFLSALCMVYFTIGSQGNRSRL